MMSWAAITKPAACLSKEANTPRDTDEKGPAPCAGDAFRTLSFRPHVPKEEGRERRGWCPLFLLFLVALPSRRGEGCVVMCCSALPLSGVVRDWIWASTLIKNTRTDWAMGAALRDATDRVPAFTGSFQRRLVRRFFFGRGRRGGGWQSRLLLSGGGGVEG